MKDLYNTNFFKDISIKVENKTLILNLIEYPIIENIQIVGIKSQNFIDKLYENISLKERMSFSENIFSKDLILIENILKANGFYFAKINSNLVKDDNKNSVKINITIDQGKKAKIKKISFIGNKSVKDKRLLEVISSEEHKFWKFISRNVYLNEINIDLDKRLLQNFYKNLGYYNVKILNSSAELTKYGNFELTYTIDSGDVYTFNEFDLNIPDDYNSSDFKKLNLLFENLKGQTYSLNDLNLILEQIEYIASTKFYDFINADVSETIIDNNKINFLFRINDSEKFYVEKINVLGNYNTQEEVIRNRLIVDEGDPLNNLLYSKSLDEIKGLGIFKSVKGEIKDGSSENLKIIDVVIEEKATGEISLAAGVGTSGSVIGGGVKEKNFLGKGIQLSTNLSISEEAIKGEFIYSKPNFAYTDNTLSTSLSATSSDFLTDYGYKTSNTGFSLGTTFEQYENLFFSPEFSFDIERLETNSNASTQLKKQEGTYEDFYFNYGINYDLRDSKYNPTRGYVSNFYQELPIISGNNEISNIINFTNYKTLNKKNNMVGKSSIYFKAVNTLDSSDVRISKRATVPYNRLRGFEKGKIGPIDNGDYIGGNYVSSINLSTNLPGLLPTIENVDFSYFIDAANVWGVDYDNSIDESNKIRSSTGIGVDLLTPIGPMSFSFTQPITKNSTDKTETFRFNLGTTF